MEQNACLRQCARAGMEVLEPVLRSWILRRLRLPEGIREDDLYTLCQLSLKLQLHGGEDRDAQALEERLKKYDCHQTELAVQKKVLLMLQLERTVQVHPAPGGSIRTVTEFAAYLCQEIRKEEMS